MAEGYDAPTDYKASAMHVQYVHPFVAWDIVLIIIFARYPKMHDTYAMQVKCSNNVNLIIKKSSSINYYLFAISN